MNLFWGVFFCYHKQILLLTEIIVLGSLLLHSFHVYCLEICLEGVLIFNLMFWLLIDAIRDAFRHLAMRITFQLWIVITFKLLKLNQRTSFEIFDLLTLKSIVRVLTTVTVTIQFNCIKVILLIVIVEVRISQLIVGCLP